jgi:uncharacterized membrane protein
MWSVYYNNNLTIEVQILILFTLSCFVLVECSLINILLLLNFCWIVIFSPHVFFCLTYLSSFVSDSIEVLHILSDYNVFSLYISLHNPRFNTFLFRLIGDYFWGHIFESIYEAYRLIGFVKMN